ncbi:peptidyl-prolyl cis-trans isomerase [cyanobiont of Ornithocercus magnificus]|nr:peptidyl-prolyl cis-trans isomerase [cyanobiont of Ornithocercus magnificus]
MASPRVVNALLVVVTALKLFWWTSPVLAGLPQGNAVKDPEAILRDALPFNQENLRRLQHQIEGTSNDLRAKRWGALVKSVKQGQDLLGASGSQILQDIPANHQQMGQQLLEEIAADLETLSQEASSEDKSSFISLRRTTLRRIGELENLLVNGISFTIPEDFDDLPRLLGRATVSIETTQGQLTTIVDGFNAPLTAGAFVDLVEKGFYDNLPFTRAEDFYILQTGDPEGPAIGYVDPAMGVERHVPLEISIPGEPEIFYNQTFEDLGFYKATPTLPFATLGTLGWAHSDQALDDGSSQFFLFLYEAELTPAGLNLVDGRNAAFGYVVDGFDVLEQIGVDDRVLAAKVVAGQDNFRPHA